MACLRSCSVNRRKATDGAEPGSFSIRAVVPIVYGDVFKYGGYFILAYLNRPDVLIDAYGTFKAIPYMVNYSLWKEESNEVDNDLIAAQFSVRF